MVESINMSTTRRRAKTEKRDAEADAHIEAWNKSLDKIERDMRELAARLRERARILRALPRL